MNTKRNLLKTLRQNPTVRRVGIPLYRLSSTTQSFRYPPPRVLVNSIPKSGTHLVTSLLAHVPKMVHSGRHHELDEFEIPKAWSQTGSYDWRRMSHALRAIRDGQYATGHFPACSEVHDAIQAMALRVIYIYRDPRDVVISAMRYRTSHPHHALGDTYRDQFRNDHERLMATIEGRAATRQARGWLPIDVELRRYLGWLTPMPFVYICRYEDLIGARGGGSVAAQREHVLGIMRFVNREASEDMVEKIAAKTWTTRSATFQQGRIGAWREYFTDEHMQAFEERAGDMLESMGYH